MENEALVIVPSVPNVARLVFVWLPRHFDGAVNVGGTAASWGLMLAHVLQLSSKAGAKRSAYPVNQLAVKPGGAFGSEYATVGCIQWTEQHSGQHEWCGYPSAESVGVEYEAGTVGHYHRIVYLPLRYVVSSSSTTSDVRHAFAS